MMIGTLAIRHYVAVMGKLGFSPEAILAGSDIDQNKLGDSTYAIDQAQYRTVIHNILNVTGDNGIGFDMARLPHLSYFGAISHAITTSKTLRDSHNLWVRFGAPLAGTLGRLEVIEETASTVTLIMASPEPNDPIFQFCVEEILGLLHEVAVPLVEEHSAFIRLSLSYGAPKHARRYSKLFNCPVQFGEKHTKVRIDREWFDSPVQTHDEELHTICIDHCCKMEQRIESKMPILTSLEQALNQRTKSFLPLPKLEEAASLLQLTPRTFRRRLSEAGTSYREQIDKYRTEQAKKYLSFGTVSSKEVAYLLGFNEQSAFRHAFKTWTGRTIGEYRNSTSKPRALQIVG